MRKYGKALFIGSFAIVVGLFVFGIIQYQNRGKEAPDVGNKVASEEKSKDAIVEDVETGVEKPLDVVETAVEKTEWTLETAVEEVIPFETTEIKDDDLEKGKTHIAQEGVDGIKMVTYLVTFEGEKEVSREELKSEVKVEPKKKIVMIGNKVVVAKEEPKPTPVKVEPKPIEPKPVEPKPVTPKPVEPKPVEPRPVEPKPVEPKPVEPKPVEPTPQPTGVNIPDGTGKDMDKFIESIFANMVYEIERVHHDTEVKGTILKMISPPGIYPENSVIKLRVSDGKPPIEENKQANGLEMPKTYNSSVSTSHENELVRLLNEYRVANGLNALEVKSDLVKSARYKSDSMLQFNYFSHDNPHLGGISFSSLLYSKFGYNHYNGLGENLISGSGGSSYRTAQYLMDGWKNSPGHNENMLDPGWKYVGIGVITSPTSGSKYKELPTILGTQHFGQ